VFVAFWLVKFGNPSCVVGVPLSALRAAVLAALSLDGPLEFGLPMKMTKLLPQVFAAVSGERNVEYGVV
jgi:hypothetical protein